MSKPRAVTTLLVFAALGTTPGQAHDAWPRPSSFQVDPGGLVQVELELDDGTGRRELLARPASPPLARLVAIGPAGEVVDLVGVAGRRPAGIWRPTQPGSWTLVYENEPRQHQLDTAAFEAYLMEEGLEHALERLRNNPSGSVAELWSRHTKALVTVGDHAAADRSLGLELELVVESADANQLVVRVERRGQAVVGALVDLYPASGKPVGHVRSDTNGRATFPCHRGALAATTTAIEALEGAVPWRGHFAATAFENTAACTQP
jgi:hypothetical protein